MQERIDLELALVKERFPNVEYQPEGRWVLVISYPLPEGWNRETTDIAFQIGNGYPGAQPYGFYVPSGILFQGTVPGSYTDPAPNQPPFEGPWGFFSWAPKSGWFPASDVRQGANLLDWVRGFKDRFEEGA